MNKNIINEDKQSDISKLIYQQKEAGVNQLIFGMSILALIGLPISLSRMAYTGWQPAYYIHIIGLLVILSLFMLRNRLRGTVKAWIILIITVTVAIFGLLTYGFIGNGMLWSMFSLFLAMAFINLRAAYLIGVVIFITLIISCYQFVYNEHIFPGDIEVYLASLPSWGTTVFGAAVFSVLIVSIVSMQRNQTEKLLIVLAQKNKDISYMANHDDLTGLPVYRVFIQTVNQCIKRARKEYRFIAVCFMDLDGFKQVNDTFGHDAGDHILKMVANEIKNSVSESDMVSRKAGDEFVILINNKEDTNLEEFCTRLLRTVSKTRTYKGQSIKVSASIGVSQFTNEIETADQLIKIADNLMYSVKIKDKNNFRISS